MTLTDCVLAAGFLAVIWALCWFQLAIAEALQGKRILPVPMGGGFDVRSTDVNGFLQMYGLGALGGAAKAPAKAAGR